MQQPMPSWLRPEPEEDEDIITRSRTPPALWVPKREGFVRTRRASALREGQSDHPRNVAFLEVVHLLPPRSPASVLWCTHWWTFAKAISRKTSVLGTMFRNCVPSWLPVQSHPRRSLNHNKFHLPFLPFPPWSVATVVLFAVVLVAPTKFPLLAPCGFVRLIAPALGAMRMGPL